MQFTLVDRTSSRCPSSNVLNDTFAREIRTLFQGPHETLAVPSMGICEVRFQFKNRDIPSKTWVIFIQEGDVFFIFVPRNCGMCWCEKASPLVPSACPHRRAAEPLCCGRCLRRGMVSSPHTPRTSAPCRRARGARRWALRVAACPQLGSTMSSEIPSTCRRLEVFSSPAWTARAFHRWGRSAHSRGRGAWLAWSC